jgi:hypothetical protein
MGGAAVRCTFVRSIDMHAKERRVFLWPDSWAEKQAGVLAVGGRKGGKIRGIESINGCMHH